MKVVLAEFDKGPMLGRKREKLFSGNCPKISWERFKGRRTISENILGKILRADGQFRKYPGKDFKGGRTIPKISWERFKGGRLQD